MEMVAAIVHQLTRNLSDEDVRNNSAFAPYFVDHTTGIYPTARLRLPLDRRLHPVHRRPHCRSDGGPGSRRCNGAWPTSHKPQQIP